MVSTWLQWYPHGYSGIHVVSTWYPHGYSGIHMVTVVPPPFIADTVNFGACPC